MSRSARTRALRDVDADEALRFRGLVKVPLLDGDEVQALLSMVESFGLSGQSGFYDTAAADLTLVDRQEIHRAVTDLLGPAVERTLVGYVPVMSALINKWPGSNSQKELHRDLRIVDERRHRALCVWVPLVDVDESNGALCVLPGSHLVETSIRSAPRTPGVPADPVHDLTFSQMETVPARPGEALVFDLAIIHGSDVNRSDAPRPAVGVALVPDGAATSMLYCHRDGRVEVFRVSDPDDFRRMSWSEPPLGLRSAGLLANRPPPMSVDELILRSHAVANGSPTEAGSANRGSGVEP